MPPRDFIDRHEADIVPIIGVFRAGIAEANKESHGVASRLVRDFASWFVSDFWMFAA